MTKDELRAKLLTRRRKLSREEISQKSQAILTRLMQVVDWSQVKQIHCYQAAAAEVQTKQFIDWAKEHGIKVVVPEQKAAEPAKSDLAKKYDLIVVPVLGFDTSLHRLGQGGGYYDRLLASQPESRSIGLCFEVGRVAKGLPHEPHDQKVDALITEDRTYPAKLV